MSAAVVIPGARYHHWTVLRGAPATYARHTRAVCRCDCGRMGSVRVTFLTQGKSRSCRSCANRTNAEKRTRGDYAKPVASPGPEVADGPRCRCGLLLPCHHEPRSATAGLGAQSW